MVPLFIDHEVTHVITDGVLNHFPDVNMVRAKDVGLAEAEDAELLAWATENRRVLVSCDANTMIDAANERLRQGLPMLGLVLVRQSLAYRVAIEDLAAIALCSEPSEWAGKVTYLPLNS
jgi:predicted nuclease of predicted toxin-antitoxin system